MAPKATPGRKTMKTLNVTLLFLATALAVARPASAQESHDSVVIVLDGSGSMEGSMGGGRSKMQAAKAALQRVVSQLDENTHVGILAFGSVGAARWLYPLGPVEDFDALKSGIRRIQAAGGTPLGQCIKLGADALLEDRRQQYGYGSYTLLVVTDGEANDPWFVDEYAPEIVARGIRLDVIGVAMKKAHTLANTAHSYRRADDPESLERAVSDVFAEVTAASTDAAPGEGAFELASALQPEMALEVIAALASSGNHPIGDPPPAPAAEEASDTEYSAFSDDLDPSAADEDDGLGFVPYLFLGFAIALVWFIRSAAKSKS